MRRALLVIGLLVGLVALWSLSKSRTYQVFGDVVTRIETDTPLVALTFDDGPSRKHTFAVLDTLAAMNVQTTFFVTGHEAANAPDLLRQIADQGHGLGNHSFHHERLILKTTGQIREDLAATDQVIRDAGYDGAIPFRPPYGQKLFALPWVLSQQDRPSVMWDVALLDEGLSPEQLAAQIIADTRPGSIILMHVMYDGRENERAAVPLIVNGLRAKGYQFVTVPDLLDAGEASVK